MKPNDKARLFIDICSKYPYGLIVKFNDKNLCVEEVHFSRGDYFLTLSDGIKKYVGVSVERVKPYLKSIKNMTEEEREEYYSTFNHLDDDLGSKIVYPSIASNDWLNAHHYDCRGFIEEGLALEATPDIYK